MACVLFTWSSSSWHPVREHFTERIAVYSSGVEKSTSTSRWSRNTTKRPLHNATSAPRDYPRCVSMKWTVCVCSCPNYQNLPPQCRLIPDPNNSCCKTYVCDVQVTTTAAPAGQGGVPTPAAGVGESFSSLKTSFHSGTQTAFIVGVLVLLLSDLKHFPMSSSLPLLPPSSTDRA